MTTPLQITIPAVTDTSLPYFRDDADNVEGSLVRVQLDHPSNPVTGVPANGQAIPNIAWREAARVLGGGQSQTGLACTYNQVGYTGTDGMVERSTKGGLHTISSQSAQVAGHGGGFEFPAAIKAYLAAHTNHAIYIGVQKLHTRLPAYTTSNIGRRASIIDTTNAANYLVELWEGLATGTTQRQSTYLGQRINTALTLGPTLHNNAASGWQGTAPAAANIAAGYYFGDYPNTVVQPVGSRQQHPSEVFYELYCEDLTISGRSYAQVDAAQNARYTANVVTAGGRYFGDTTPSAPSSIP